MGSDGGDGNNIGGSHFQTHDPISNPLSRQGSLYNLTLDEVQTQLGDLGKPLTSMNLDELLKTLSTAEAINPLGKGAVCGTALNLPGQPSSGLSLNQQSNDMLPVNLSTKTVDEVWQYIQKGEKMSSLDRKTTLGEMTLEDFLVKAGVVADSAGGKKISGPIAGVGDSTTEMDQHSQWMDYQMSNINPQQQQSMLPVFMSNHPVQQMMTLGGNHTMADTQMTASSSPLMGTLSDTQTLGRKRIAPDDVAEKSVERKQKRMIKNRESAARSRARKQAYTHELENKISRLEEENERLRRLNEVEKALPVIPPPPEPKFRLRRTSSAP